jgi:hypothetical protein
MAYEIHNLRPTLSNSVRYPPNNPQGILEPWTTPGVPYNSNIVDVSISFIVSNRARNNFPTPDSIPHQHS